MNRMDLFIFYKDLMVGVCKMSCRLYVKFLFYAVVFILISRLKYVHV